MQLWNPQGAAPESIWQVMGRQKDIQYASRADSHIARHEAGLIDARECIAQALWQRPVPEHEGVIVHDHLSSCSTM